MKKIMMLSLSILLMFGVFGCSAQPEENLPVETDFPTAPESTVAGFYESMVEEYAWGSSVNFYDNQTAWEAFARYRDFADRLLLNALTRGENEVISPLSVYYALAILDNGTAGSSRSQLENVLGMNTDDLNSFLKDLDSWSFGIGQEHPFYKANALCFNTHYGLTLKEEFKETIKEYYGDQITEYDFGSGSGLAAQVNRWAAENTDGIIDQVVEDDDFSAETSFLILNALAAGDYWSFKFDSGETRYEEFKAYDGSTRMTEMMHQTLWGHWSDDLSEGFCKRLENGLLVAAILPKEGLDVYDYLSQLNPDSFRAYATDNTGYENEEQGGEWGCTVDEHFTNLSFPKFAYEKEYDLSETLKKMGLSGLFDAGTADLSAMAEGNQKTIDKLMVDKVKQKCSIMVDEERVEAAAVTVVAGGMGAGGCSIRQTIYHDVVFDRPFVFVILDGNQQIYLPLFIGVVSDLGEVTAEVYKLENITGKINIRSTASTSGEKLGMVEKGDVIYAIEKKENEGYTWYRIGENKWVADQGGEWLKPIE